MAEAEAEARDVAESKMTDAGNTAAAAASSFDTTTAEDDKAKPPPAAADGAAIRIETLPDALVERLKKSPFKRPLAHRKSFLERNPEFAEVILKQDAESNSLVDLQEDILRQAEEKGCAKVGVEVMACGRTRLFRLPQAS